MIDSINHAAFVNCTNLDTLYCIATYPHFLYKLKSSLCFCRQKNMVNAFWTNVLDSLVRGKFKNYMFLSVLSVLNGIYCFGIAVCVIGCGNQCNKRRNYRQL